MSLPPPWVVVLLVALAVAVDVVARRLGFHALTDESWPAGWRPRRVERGDAASPYRAVDRVEWALAVPAGIPRAVSVFVAPAALLTVLWTLCVLLAIGDLPAAFSGRRALGHALGSLALCLARALCGWRALAAAYLREPRWFAVACGAVVGLDAALALLPLPCSDVRADDVRVASAGLLVHAPMACAFAWVCWRRRGVTYARPDAAPVFH